MLDFISCLFDVAVILHFVIVLLSVATAGVGTTIFSSFSTCSLQSSSYSNSKVNCSLSHPRETHIATHNLNNVLFSKSRPKYFLQYVQYERNVNLTKPVLSFCPGKHLCSKSSLNNSSVIPVRSLFVPDKYLLQHLWAH